MKKIILLILMSFMSLLGYSQLSENFEGAPATPDGAGVWTLPGSGNWLVRDNRTNGLPNWEVNPAAFPAHQGDKAAFINRENTGPGVLAEEWLITPQINVPANRQLRFFTRQTLSGDLGTKYQVRVSSDPDQSNLAAFTILQEYTETELSVLTDDQLDYEEKIINFAFTGNRYFAFVKVFTQPAAATSGDRWLIDDVQILERCADPTTLLVENTTVTSTTATWVSTAPNFTLEWGLSGFVPGTGTIIQNIANNSNPPAVPNSYPIIGLTPDTQYQYYITAVCSLTTSEQTGPFNFTTAPLGSTCDGPIVVTPLPYFDVGDTFQQGNNIDFNSPGATGCGTTGNFLDGDDVVYSYTVPATTTGLISIEMNPLGASNTGVFVYSNCADIGSNCIAGVGNSNGNIRSIPALTVTAGDVIYIVVSSTAATESFGYNLTIQNVTCAPPSGLSATGTGPNSANLFWENLNSYSNWEIFVQTAGSTIPSTPGDSTNTNEGTSVTQLTGTTTGLVLGTPYQYWVRADCGNGTFSQWAGPYLFNTTSCASGCNFTFDMVDAFGDGWNGNTIAIIQDGLTIATIGGTFTDGEGPVTASVPLCDGPFELFWNEGGDFSGEVGFTVTNSFGQVIYVKNFFEDEQGTQLFAGTVDCLHPSCLPPSEVTFSEIGTHGALIAWIPNGPAPLNWEIYALPAGSPPPTDATLPTATAPGTATSFELTTLAADSEYTIYVRAVCEGDGPNPWSDPTEAFTTLPTCPKPTGLNTLNADLTSITFTWTAGQDETQWIYFYQEAGLPAPLPGDSGWLPASTNSADITGLTSGTSYDFYVIAVCTPEDSSTIAGPFNSHTTVCPAAEQCLYTFTMTDQFGDGWNGNTMNILQGGIVVATIGADFEDGNGPISVQIPMCHGVAFELYWNEGGNFATEVGVSVTSFLGENIFTKPFGVGAPGSSLYMGTGECVAPTCLAPTDVVINSTGLDSALISWTENNPTPSTSWEVLVLPAADPPPAQDATGWVVANSNPYTFAGLTAATCYKVYVRSSCSATDNSFWSIGGQFCTQICAPANVCDYTFVMVDGFGDGWNGNTMSITQSGITVATLTGPTNADGQNPVSQVVTLCNNLPFELFWNVGGNFATEVGVSITNAADDIVFTHEPGDDLQGTSLFAGTVNCVPATCPKPVQLTALDVTETSANLGWIEAGTATAWEIFVLPAGSPPPANGDSGVPTTQNPYPATLTSGTAYVFYVRAICSQDDQSHWSGPKAFATLITNDECSDAIVVPVNPDQSCSQFASGTITGATASNLPNDCGGTADDDVWFQFTAVTTSHNINITNIAGSTDDLFHILYEGQDCGSMTQVYCSDNNESIATGLTPGNIYFIRVFSWTATPGQTSTFDICIGTIPPPITASTTSHTVEQLVQDVLLNSTCASVSNITYSTGTNFGSTNGIGYFEQNGSSFPFDNGVVLTTGNADSAPGPNMSTLGDGIEDWVGDADLQQVLTDQGVDGELHNATKIEFDFIPLTNNISFDFLFASEEYGTFQCTFSDVFAFLLTDTVAGTTTNLAVVPSTTTPISVINIRDELYNGGCPSVNPEYFGTFYQLPDGENPLGAPINFNGTTVPLTASATVVAGQQYHIKLAIADFNDNNYDSAVFLKGGSFGIGNIELGSNLLEATGNAVCSGESVVLNSGLDPANYTFTWLQNQEVMENQTGPSITVSAPGEYTVQVVLNNSTCTGTDTVIVEYYDAVLPGQAENLYICGPSATGVFNLTQNQAAILAPIGNNYGLNYYTSMEDAIANTDEIENPLAYTNITNPQTIYVAAVNNTSNCKGITTFQLILQDLTPQFTLPESVSICEGSSQTISVNPINFNLTEATYSWTFNGDALPDVTSSIVVTEPGLYEVTVNRSGCTATLGVNVIEQSSITPEFDAVANICQNTTAPSLPTTSNNGVIGTWSPATIDPGVSGILTYCFTPDASQTCATQVCIEVTVYPAPALAPVTDLTVCGSYLLPVLSVGGYFNLPGGNGPIDGTVAYGPGTYTIYVYGQTSTVPNCTSESSFILTVNPAPDVAPVADVIACTSYVLPALTAGAYYSSAGGVDPITGPVTQTQTVYVYDSVGTAPNICSDQEMFQVTINDLPQFTIEGGCQGNDYVLSSTPVGNFEGTVSYQWTDSQGLPVANGDGPSVTVTEPGNYTLTVTTQGCPNDNDFNVVAISCGIQRGISPGDGGKNDFFDLAGQNVKKLEIFNRYGTRVYSQVNYSREWYGQSDKGDELPDGTYFYVIVRENMADKTGWIYINRVK